MGARLEILLFSLYLYRPSNTVYQEGAITITDIFYRAAILAMVTKYQLSSAVLRVVQQIIIVGQTKPIRKTCVDEGRCSGGRTLVQTAS